MARSYTWAMQKCTLRETPLGGSGCASITGMEGLAAVDKCVLGCFTMSLTALYLSTALLWMCAASYYRTSWTGPLLLFKNFQAFGLWGSCLQRSTALRRPVILMP